MSEAAPDGHPAAPRAVALLPVAVLLHIAEEWSGGFPAWVGAVLGLELGVERFLLVNALGLAIFVAGALAALLSARLIWVGVALASLVGLNGLLHGALSLATGSYSPGMITGLLLYPPIVAAVLRAGFGRLSRPAFAGAAVLGVLVHAVATLAALG